jgi:hypothetical protein
MLPSGSLAAREALWPRISQMQTLNLEARTLSPRLFVPIFFLEFLPGTYRRCASGGGGYHIARKHICVQTYLC